ncbi:bifunctional ADP-dependent NAD(P)H-hydrate dehydratase/NAD(P)H-hydrate epimerase [Colwellia psychrerythraea]|uniref:Bifunctional NAD(P)H-hydrate repair enzyme n=1 Tax=Colwellia psychrerythraea (strain 34H / ATCC BAA-681) TaxID=167879 RepID=Q48A27_COLP3|nr:bifunctional ADP-dependent NAD(P)H-hydrate dehydratase/NAD(P)H-hydrate epimerase [Colwellia psychrerythraea]AAZ27877.1 YjeF family protein [Colwellia psychrerythraea 34H]
MKLSLSLSQKPPVTSVYTANQVLKNEANVARSQGIAMYELMHSAGAAVFTQLSLSWPNAKHLLILCGKGNNGGDGFVVAKLAHQAKIKVSVLLTCDVSQLKGDALSAYQAMIFAGVSLIVEDRVNKHAESLAIINDFSGEVIVDALFGIGFTGQLTPRLQEFVTSINHQKAKVISIDVPSGLCATTGEVQGESIEGQAIIADITLTFIVYKQGLLTGQAANFVGELFLAPLAMNNAFTKQVQTNNHYAQYKLPLNQPKRLPSSHKGDSGLLLTIGGSDTMPGAIRLASESALRCGAGLVAVSCHKNNQMFIMNGRPELMLAPETSALLEASTQLYKAKAYLVGPGLGQSDQAKQLFELISKTSQTQNKTTVIDADALILLSETKQQCNHWVLTPHPKEAAALLQCDVASIEADRFSAVRAIAKQYGGICLLKGAGTLISDGERVVINNSGNSGMASGGMGDVLSGIISALVMQSDNNFYSTCLAAYIHGAAADIIANKNGQRGLLASDLFIPLQQLLNGKVPNH